MIPFRSILATLLVLAATAAPAQTSLKYRRDVLRDDRSEAVTLVPLDASVHAETRDGYPDVRVLDDRGREVPFALRAPMKGKSVAERLPAPSRVVSLKVIEGEALEVVVELERDAPEPDGATVYTPLADFERRVRVLGSPDGRDWTPLGEGRILDYSRFMNVRDVDVAFPARGFRTFKFVIKHELDELKSPYRQLSRSREAGGPERRSEVESILRRPFRIDRVALFQTVHRFQGEEPTTTRSALDVRKVEVDRRDRVTRIEVAANRLPLARLALLTTSRNFHRSARVQRPSDFGWVDVASGALSLYALGDFHREELTLEFPETRADALRIVIDDGDNPPLEVTGVEGDAVDRRAVFVADAGRSYRLEYGSKTLDFPRYDADAVLSALGPDAPRVVATLGPPVANPDYKPSPRRWGDPGVWMFLAIVLMTAVLAWAVLQAVRKAEKRPMDEFE